MVNNIPVNGWPQLKDLEAVQPILNRLDKIEAWKRTVKEETFTGDDITIENALALPARSLITEINAIQDLHGYDEPWAGGAYKNQFDIDNPQSSSGWTISSGVLTGNNNNYAAFISNKFKGNGTMWLSEKVTASTSDYVIQVRNVTDNVEVNRWTISAGSGQSLANTFNAVSGKEYEVRYFGTSATSGTISISEIQVEEGSSATSFAPYSNICPISGRDSVVVGDVGKNVATTVIYKQDYVIASDGSENSASGYCITDRIDVSANQVYVFSFTRWQAGITDPIRVGTYKADGTFISRISIINNGDTLTVPANCAYVRLSYCNTPNQSTYLYDVQMELGSTTTPYEPYAHSSVTIQLGTTVYGADINWDTGVATVTHANIASYDGETIGEPWISSMDEYTQGGTPTTGAQVVYTVATPTTIQLTPTQLEMLKGYNHITLSDGYGTIELKAHTGANWS